MAAKIASPANGALLVGQLLKAGKLDSEYAQALIEKFKNGPAIAAFLLSQKKVSDEDLAKAAAAVMGLPFVHLEGKNIPKEVLNIIPERYARYYLAVAFEKDGDVVKVAVARPYNLAESPLASLEEVERQKGVRLAVYLTTVKDLAWALSGYRSGKEAGAAESENEPASRPAAGAQSQTRQIKPVSLNSQKDTASQVGEQTVSKPAPPAPSTSASDKGQPPSGESSFYTPNVEALVNFFVKEGVISSSQIQDYLKFNSVEKVVENLRSRNSGLDSRQYARILARSFNLPYVSLTGRKIEQEVINLIPYTISNENQVVAYAKDKEKVYLATSKPYKLSQSKHGPLHRLSSQQKFDYVVAVASPEDIKYAQQFYFKQESRYKEDTVNLTKIKIPRRTLIKFPKDIAQKYKVIAYQEISPNYIKIAAEDPDSPKTKELVDFVQNKNGIKLDVKKAAPGSIDRTIPLYDLSPEDYEKRYNVVDFDSLPVGQSPKLGGVTSSGVPVVGAGEISSVKIAQGATVQSAENLEEKNLDLFLGHFINSTLELIQIVRSGFIPKTLAAIISYGIYLRASDIHLEPLRNAYRIRYRVDGELGEYLYLPKTLHPPITSRIKILSNLKIDEQRIPQDGRYNAVAGGHEFDVRVSSLPTVYGEKIVMRLLDKTNAIFSLDDLGFRGSAKDRILKALKKPYGIVMATGPTGSGKSTTLYAALHQIASPKVNVITLEDPVEYEMKGVNQVQVKPKIGFSFAEGLRSVLRQDPNIIMVGEIRDSETAELATHAALTGHLVLTTLHTNDSAGAIPRLINMGVEPFLITSAINAVVAQRLIRKLCDNCKQVKDPPPKILEEVKKIMNGVKEFNSGTPPKFYSAKGCGECKSGFKGRLGIFEVLEMTDEVEELATGGKTADEIKEKAVEQGMITMQQDAILKAKDGLTTLDEVFKATTEDN